MLICLDAKSPTISHEYEGRVVLRLIAKKAPFDPYSHQEEDEPWDYVEDDTVSSAGRLFDAKGADTLAPLSTKVVSDTPLYKVTEVDYEATALAVGSVYYAESWVSNKGPTTFLVYVCDETLRLEVTYAHDFMGDRHPKDFRKELTQKRNHEAFDERPCFRVRLRGA